MGELERIGFEAESESELFLLELASLDEWVGSPEVSRKVRQALADPEGFNERIMR